MADFIVTSTADSGSGTLREALAQIQNGETITFDDSLEDANGVITITLAADSDALSIPAYQFTINGGSTWEESGVLKTRVVIDAAASADDLRRVATFAANSKATINGVTFKNGYQSGSVHGGAVAFSSSGTNVILNNCVFDTCQANNGGFAFINNVTIIFNNCLFFNGHTSSRGGAVYANGAAKATYNNCRFVDCNSVGGGAYYANQNSNNTFINCYFSNCYASGGGVFYVFSTPIIVCTNCTFDYCRTISGNGGVINLNAAAVVTFNDCTFTDCRAVGKGSAIYYATSAALTLNGCTFTTTQNNASVYNDSTTGTIIVKGFNSIDKIKFVSGASITFSGVDAVLAVTTTATIGSATFTAAENSNGFLVVPNIFDLSKATIGPNITVYDVSKFENRYKYRFLNWDNTNWTLSNWY